MPTEKLPIQKPPTFQDSQKRTWTIKLNLSLLDTVLSETQVDLAPKDNDLSKIVGLLFDDRELGSVLWVCCRDQAKANDIDKASFLGSLDGEALKNGWGAVVDAIVFFTQSKSPKLATAMLQQVEMQMSFLEAGAAKIVETIKSESTDQKLKALVTKIGDEMQKGMTEGLENIAMPSEE